SDNHSSFSPGERFSGGMVCRSGTRPARRADLPHLGNATMFRSLSASLHVVKKYLRLVCGPLGREARRRPARRPLPLTLETLECRLTPASRLIATSYFDGAVYEFNAKTGALLGTLAAPNNASSLLSGPAGMAIGPDNNLYISSQNNDAILQYDLGSN